MSAPEVSQPFGVNGDVAGLQPRGAPLCSLPPMIDREYPVILVPEKAPATNNANETANPALKDKQEPPKPSIIVPTALVEGLDPKTMDRGVLIPLKTTLEIRQDHAIVQVYITRALTKNANDVVNMLRDMTGEGYINNLPHLRRCAKPSDLPAHLKTCLMNDNPEGRLVHTGKSTWIYIVLGEVKDLDRTDLIQRLKAIEGMEGEPFIEQIPVPLTPPISQVQAAMWSSQFWPSVYRKNNPLGPHPGMVARASDEIKHDVSLWMSIAHRVGRRAHEAGIGEAMGAVLVQRKDGYAQLIAVAGDARWHQERSRDDTGNPMAHSALRAISMVAQKLVRHERRAAGHEPSAPQLFYDAFQDAPLLDEEKEIFEEQHPDPDGYLCHGLELYLTHEPCVQCSMGILHSRMGKIVFARRQTLTGGMCSETRGHGHPELQEQGGGQGLGLFWRRELNWSLLAWEWEPFEMAIELPSQPASPTIHV